ncbi:hypothetical protein ACJIZ3_009664 [Penstemon smallii]|uniref:TORTIFOLIA1/SINE1-2 N-terminal domain-containing protein n=1 Tax=Penstemon smallii TaxID=265156 RepID=A0ABD3TEX9_9LAMI
MGRSLSPILRKELENLDKDADSRKSAMKALKSHVKDLDPKGIPMFIAQVSETKQTGISSGEHTISLYEVLARSHGPKIVPQIDNIMSTIVKTLSSSGGAFALHQACSKVVPAIARYAIGPTTADDKKRYVIHSLCKPLSDCLLGGRSQENHLSSGAALCLQSLVEADNWRFASNEMVHEVCQRVTGALEKHSQTNSHMALVMALAKHNSLIVEPYARMLISTGLHILNVGFEEGNSQKQFSAIHMVSSLMRCLDPISILPELELIITEMNKCQFGRMPFVSGAASEAVLIAKRICAEKGSKYERDTCSGTGSNFDRREKNTRRRNSCSGDQSPLTASPESQTVDSFVGYDYFIESPNSMNHRSVNRKLWQRCQNGGLDVSLKDGIFSQFSQGSDIMSSEYNGFSDNHREDHHENFTGFVQGSPRNGFVRSNTPSPQRSNSRINVDDVRIYTTPRKLIRSLQNSDDVNSGFSVKQIKRYESPTPSTYLVTPTMRHQVNGLSQDMNCDKDRDENMSFDGEQFHCTSESISSTEDVFTDKDLRSSPLEVIHENKFRIRKNHQSYIVCVLFVILAVIFCLMEIRDQNDLYVLVPT